MKKFPDASKFIQVNGELLPYRIERRSVRCARLEFRAGELLVILPRSLTDETSLLKEKRGWISKKHAEMRGAMERLDARMNGPQSLPVLGESFELRESEYLIFDPYRKVIECDPGDRNHLRRLSAILKKMLLRELEQAVQHYSSKFGVRPNRISVKKQRARWGSCSSRGNLNFNLRLICLPGELIWYVACHEVLHLKEGRHNKAFRGSMAREFSEYKKLEKELSDYWLFLHECTKREPLASLFSDSL